MRLQNYLNEEYFSRTENTKYYEGTEIFKNPSEKEKNNFVRIRFITDDLKKDLYIWDAVKLIHKDFWNKFLNKRGYQTKSENFNIISGVAKKISGKWYMVDSDIQRWLIVGKTPDFINNVVNNFDWVNKYINIEKFLKSDEFREKYSD